MILELTKESISAFLISDSSQMPNHWREENLGVDLIIRNSMLSFFTPKHSNTFYILIDSFSVNLFRVSK